MMVAEMMLMIDADKNEKVTVDSDFEDVNKEL